jgi:hypothetical protein
VVPEWVSALVGGRWLRRYGLVEPRMAPDFLMRKGSRLFRFKAALGLFQALPDLGLPEKGIQFIADGIGPVSRHGSSLPAPFASAAAPSISV